MPGVDLAGKTALVAGASRGIGLRLAEGLAEQGARVVACGRSPEPARLAPSIRYRPCDLGRDDEVAALAAEAAAATGAIHVVLFSAAVTHTAAGGLQSLADFTRTLDANLVAAYRCVLAADPYLAPDASIILVTSINARLGFPGNPGYVAAKGGLAQLVKALAVDLGPRGVRVNALAPGYIRTDMTAQSYADPERRRAREARTILGRWGEPDDLVGAAVFLASDASRYMTGQELCVDGGWTAKGL